MKVLALVILAAASVTSLGSGPYLPSGWRPQGPAFYLPSEAQKPAENPLKDTILSESEASGSDALREYGPPKVVEVSQDLTRQALPETVTEQAFVVVEAKFIEEVNGEVKEVQVKAIEEVKAEEVTEVQAVEVTTEQKAVEEAVTATTAEQSVPQGRAIDVQAIEETVVSQEATTDSVDATTGEVTEIVATVGDSNVESTQVEQQGRAIDVQAIEQTVVSQKATTDVDATTGEVTEIVATVVDSNVESTQVEQVSHVQAVQEVSEAEVSQEVRTVEGVDNVVEALTNLEKEIKAQQVQSNEEAVEVKSVEIVGSEQAQVPEGFLEYGPPGFREYGPPQVGDLARIGSIAQEISEEEQKIENNETRRRRFSPKFRSSKKH